MVVDQGHIHGQLCVHISYNERSETFYFNPIRPGEEVIFALLGGLDKYLWNGERYYPEILGLSPTFIGEILKSK